MSGRFPSAFPLYIHRPCMNSSLHAQPRLAVGSTSHFWEGKFVFHKAIEFTETPSWLAAPGKKPRKRLAPPGAWAPGKAVST